MWWQLVKLAVDCIEIVKQKNMDVLTSVQKWLARWTIPFWFTEDSLKHPANLLKSAVCCYTIDCNEWEMAVDGMWLL